MVKKTALFALYLGLALLQFNAYAQDTSSDGTRRGTARPNIPGSFVLELGFNQPFNTPDEFDLGFWGSRTANVYYQYDMRILKSKFSFHPGIGLSLERYKFTDNKTLAYGTGQNEGNVELVDGIAGTRKSMLVTNYLDVPLELRFSTNPDDPVRSFKASVGGRVGFLYNSFTKVKYKEDSELKKFKDKQNFNLEKLRYGVYAKIGVGNFSVFGYYNLTPLFEENKGPLQTDMNNFTVGISLSSF